jgi:hypothetical protein
MVKPVTGGALVSLLRFSLLPLRAPFLLLLLLVSVYLGMHWMVQAPFGESARLGLASSYRLYWSIECLQAVIVVVIASMPDLLLRQLSLLMAASRVITLVVSLLLVTIAGLYLLHLSALADVAILGTAVLLARLDLIRIYVAPPPLLTAISLSIYVLLGIGLGRWLHLEEVWRGVL